MISFLGLRKKIGIDIGTFSVKVVALEKKLLNRKRSISYAIEYLPAESVSTTQIQEAIKRAIKKIGLSSSRVNISVSGQEVIFRYIQLPLIRSSEVIETIKLEWDKYISLKLDEVIWDFEVLGDIEDPLKGKQKLVLVVAIKKDFLEQQVHLLKEASLVSGVIGTNVTSLVNAFNLLYPVESKNSLFALLNIGGTITNLIVLKDGIPRFSRDILFGGRDITYLIASKQRIDIAKAQELKHNFNGDNEEVVSLIKNSIVNLTNEIRFSFEYLKRDLEEQIKTIYISGGSSHLYKIKEFLSQDLGINVEIWRLNGSLRQNLINPGNDLERYFPELVVALGLVLS